MITLLLALATVQDTTIVIHAESSSATLEARALPRVVSEEIIRFYNAPGTTRLVGRTRLPRGNEWRGNVAVRNGPVLVAGRVQGSLGVFRSAGDLSDRRSDLGYMFRSELRAGDVRPVGHALRAFDVVSPVEDWGLHSAEIGWSAFLFGRDYRDYYLNKGWAARAFAQPERQISLAVALRRESQTSVATQDPWTVFRTSVQWRTTPPID